jgi:hypothetical protein
MNKKVFYGILIAAAVILFVWIAFAVQPSNSIESDVFFIRDWNHKEYVENWKQTIQGTVIKQMPAKEKGQYNCIIEVRKDSANIHYLCYFVDKVEHPVGEVTGELVGVNVGSYNYEETVDYVRQLPVFLSMDVVNGYKLK